MSGKGFHITLVPIWEAQRALTLALGYELHASLQGPEPPVTLHGRDLRPAEEGVGFQFQFTLNDALYGGSARSAYYVLQLQLQKRAVGVGWLVDAMPVLEYGDERYDLYQRRSYTLPVANRQELRRLFVEELAADAGAFFAAVRAGEPLAERAAPFYGGRTPAP